VPVLHIPAQGLCPWIASTLKLLHSDMNAHCQVGNSMNALCWWCFPSISLFFLSLLSCVNTGTVELQLI